MASEHAPILSTPAEHILEEAAPVVLPSTEARLTEDQLHLQYEIKRTINEIRQGRWKRIALQFPDAMLSDAPRVFEALRDGLKNSRQASRPQHPSSHTNEPTHDVTETLQRASLSDPSLVGDAGFDEIDEKLTILGDTSYGACCVDEVAAEHVDADVVVHYGRSCLSPTARLPVIYVYTSKPLDLDMVVKSFLSTFPNKHDKICLMADIPYGHHLDTLQERLVRDGYGHIFSTQIIRDHTSPLPNRTVPAQVQENTETLKEYSIFHISNPPASLLLILSSRIKSIHILPTDTSAPTTVEASTAQLLRRRYALLTRLSTVPIFGILINTLSVANYMDALEHCQGLISRAGKKSYTFVVGKVNAAKVANFSEIGGWVVIGCWESSLIESKEFFKPIITPFELEMALTDDKERVWGGEWVGDFSQLLGKERKLTMNGGQTGELNGNDEIASTGEGNWDDQPSDDEPPEFDLRTGRYVSNSRPMGRPTRAQATNGESSTGKGNGAAPPSSALVQRAKGDVATVGGQVSPAAEFLRSKRTWQGLGSDFEIAYDRDEDGKIQGAAMEEGRSGVAKGYTVGESERT
ncbi:Diphthamide biosynthesis 2 [Lecanosticta acicola]|uniref:2-(3-amino-3-carboxypropyl)histidine synthase subunit 2 n=1 Tax=Lecanosticta acicola TaxID=111012 RepID=A0AAI9E9I5_9PEZI|nr:Diphthamide biosynthesis 2 [Lecanosticta acicola]